MPNNDGGVMTTLQDGRLEGLRALVVEDEVTIAMVLEDALREAGCVLVGPIPRVGKAVEVARAEPIDFALLDVNLAGEKVFPVADVLAERNVPFVFLTGYGRSELPAAYADRPAMAKPFKLAALLGVVAALFLS
jgi:DNA-binding response OmpR family regulator